MTEDQRYWLERDFAMDLFKQLRVHIFWKNTDCIYLGCNETFAQALGFSSPQEIIGKSDYDLPIKKEKSDLYREDDKEVMKSLQPKLDIEEEQIFSDGRKAFLLTSKIPLLNKKNNRVMGILGIYHDITEIKNNQERISRLELENQLLKNQEKFIKIANQVVHDIRSPLASLLMIVKSCTEIPENDRIALREAIISIGDIANHLLSHYQKNEHTADLAEPCQPVLVSALLLQILTDKKYQYCNLKIEFEHDFKSENYFSFISIAPSDFKRMLSNLINNAVDAFDGLPGKVILKLEGNKEWLKIFIIDNGKGIPPEVLEKIMKRISVTSGKKSGHGLGMTQILDTIDHCQGEISIDSKVGKGTVISLVFPIIKEPVWFLKEIKLEKDDTVIILDDDSSIHGAWDRRFKSILCETPELKLKHFQKGEEALEFLKNLTPSGKEKIVLLTDYELLKQELNGLHVISQSGIKRSILVTSHFANPLIQEQAVRTNTKILPKYLSSEILIKINEPLGVIQEEVSNRFTQLVILDDDESFVNNLIFFILHDKNVDKYHDPKQFLENFSKYPKDTQFLIDNNYSNSNFRGLEIARILYEQGYKNLYILSGENFDNKDLHDHVVIISKTDIDRLSKL